MRRLGAWVLGFAVLCGTALAETYPLTGTNTKIEFVGSKSNGKHTGGFQKLSGTASVSNNDPSTLQLDCTIDLDSMYTDDRKLTAHLKSPDFFEVKRYPTAVFKVTKVTPSRNGLLIRGDLTLHGVTKPVEFPARLQVTDEKLSLSSDFKINRHDWGISYGKGIVHDDVSLKINLQADRSK